MFLWKIWIRRFWVIAGCFLALCGFFNLLVDPFDLYRLVAVEGINGNKPMATKHPRIVKPYQVKKLRPLAVAMGSSRTEIGIDPEHPGWDARFRPVFNYSLGAAAIMELADRFDSLQQISPVGQVVMGLDFFMFNAYADNPMDQLDDGSNMSALDYWITSLLTVDALVASVDTLRKQDPIQHPGVRSNGQIDWTFNTRRVAKYGHRNGFERFLEQFLETTYFPVPDQKYALLHPVSGVSSVDAFRRIVTLARRDGVDLRLFISPMHAQLCVVIDHLGLWAVYEDWKRQLVSVIEDDAAAHPEQRPFELWDFSGFNTVTTEPVPMAGDTRTQMDYYWECSHYKKEAGDLVLDRLFGYAVPQRTLPDDFGVLLRQNNVEDFLAETRIGLAAYQERFPEEIAAIIHLQSRLDQGGK